MLIMKANLKNIIEKDLLNLSINYFDNKDIKNTFVLKKNDDLDFIEHRFNLGLSNSLSTNYDQIILDSKISKYLLENVDKNTKILIFTQILKSNITNAENFKSKYLQDIDPSSNSYIELVMLENELDTILNQDKSNISLVINNLNDLDKKLVPFFNNLSCNFTFFEKINFIRNSIWNNIFLLKIEGLKHTKDKKQELTKVYAEYLDSVNKKQTVISNVISKIIEVITKQQSKILLNVQKLRHPDLTKNIQLYLSINNDISKIYDKFLSSKNTNIDFSLLNTQIVDKVNSLKNISDSINRIATKTILDDIKDYLNYFNCLYFYRNRILELKSFSNLDKDNILVLTNNIYTDLKNISSFNLFAINNCNYINIKSYLDNSFKNSNLSYINLSFNSSISFPIFNINEDLVSYGDVFIKVIKLKESFKLEYKGKTFDRNKKTLVNYTLHYIFEDTDDVVKNILEVIKTYDFLKIIK